MLLLSTTYNHLGRQSAIAAFSLVLLFGSLALNPIALAQQSGTNQTREYDIPAGPLGEVLSRFAAEAGILLSGDGALTANQSSHGLQGRYTVREGLNRLLSGTGLAARFNAENTVTISRAADGEQILAPITVEGSRESAYGPVQGYKAERTATATRTDVAIRDMPASVHVVPREVVGDQAAVRIADALQNISNVHHAGTSGGRIEEFTIRGFRSGTRRIARDGFYSPATFGQMDPADMAGIERVEVLKGPASVLYGQTAPGGIINLVTKKPLADSFQTYDLKVGSYDLYRAEVDVNQPFTTDNHVLFRLNGTAHTADSSRGETFRSVLRDTDRLFVSPALRWIVDENTNLDVQLDYIQETLPIDFGLIPINGRADVLPRDFTIAESFVRYDAEEYRAQATFEHRFHETWSLRSSLLYSRNTGDRLSVDAAGDVQPDGTLERRVRIEDDAQKDYAMLNQLTTSFTTGSVDHEFLAGADVTKTRADRTDSRAPLDPINVFDPVYGATPGAFGEPRLRPRELDTYSVFLQDLVSFGPQWKVLTGIRYDHADLRDRDTTQVDEDFTPRFGLVYQPTENLSLYASYSESFEPVIGESIDGSPFDPTLGEQYEIGIKSEFFDDRLLATVALFELTQENIRTPDPNNPGFSIQIGEQRSRGAELDIVGEISDGWKLIGSLAHLDAEITEDNELPVGNRLGNVPKWSGSLWSSYAVQDGVLSGFKIGGGVFAVGRRYGDAENTYIAPGYARLDAALTYTASERYEFSVNFRNLLDKDYIIGTSSNSAYPGEPFTVLARFTARL